jgi:hypothetical protein
VYWTIFYLLLYSCTVCQALNIKLEGIKNQEKTYELETTQSAELDADIVMMLELSNNRYKIIMIYYYDHKLVENGEMDNSSRKKETIRKNQVGILEIKQTK